MERKFLVKPFLKPPLKIGVIGVFSAGYSSSIFFSKGFEESNKVSSVIRFDYRRALKERVNFIQNMVDVARKVDLMVVMKGSGIPLQTFKLCSKYCTILFWMMDTYSHFNRNPMMLENSIFCDYRTATGYGTCKLWEEKINLPVHHILDGSDISKYYPCSNVGKQYDVSFIGGSDRERDSIYNFLKNKYRVKFFGPKYSNRFVTPNEFREICCKSKIVLNISRGNYKGYSSLRLWNLLACGSIVLTKKIPEMIEHMGLEAGKHITEFSSFVDLVRKIDYYLKNDKDRKTIENNGLKFVKSKRTWKNSANDIINLVLSKQGKTLVPETIGLVIPTKRKRLSKKHSVNKSKNRNIVNKISKLNKKARTKAEKKISKAKNKKIKKPIGISRKVKAGWITA